MLVYIWLVLGIRQYDVKDYTKMKEMSEISWIFAEFFFKKMCQVGTRKEIKHPKFETRTYIYLY